MAWKPPAEDRIAPKGWAPPASDRIDTAKPVVVVPLDASGIIPNKHSGPRKIYSAFTPGAKSRYDTDEARASAYAQSLAAQGKVPSPVERLLPRAASVARSGMPRLSDFTRLAFATGKDLSSAPGRLATSLAQQGINTLRGTKDSEYTMDFGMADPTGRAIGQKNFITDIARDPYLLPSLLLTRGKSLMPRIAGGLAVGLGAPMLDRAADYDAKTAWMPSTMDLLSQGAMAIAPEGIGALGTALATPARTTAKRMFISQVKPPPALKKGQVWASVDNFSDDPALMRELIGDRTSYPDLVEGWDIGNARREAIVDPVMKRMQEQGVRIPVSAATKGARSGLSQMSEGEATLAEMMAARNEVDVLATQPIASHRAMILDDIPGPYPPRLSFDPYEARTFKSKARKRVKDFTDPMSDVRSAAFGGAGKGIQTALEAADETGTLAAKNAEWGRWLDVQEAIYRMQNRATNNNPAKWWQFIKKNRENPQLVIKMLDAERGLRGAGETALQVSPFTRSLIMQHAEDGAYE